MASPTFQNSWSDIGGGIGGCDNDDGDQPSRTLGQADHDNIALVLIMMMVIVMAIKEANTKKEEELRQVNQQKHMVANKFDPRMDPVVVQVLVVDVQVLVVQAQQ